LNSKERVITAINLKRPDRVPLDGYFRQDVWAKLEEHLGTNDAEKIMEALGLDIRYTMLEPSLAFTERAIPSPWQIPEIGMGRKNLVIKRDNGWLEDEYGICRIPNSNGLYWVYTCHPLAEAYIGFTPAIHWLKQDWKESRNINFLSLIWKNVTKMSVPMSLAGVINASLLLNSGIFLNHHGN